MVAEVEAAQPLVALNSLRRPATVEEESESESESDSSMSISSAEDGPDEVEPRIIESPFHVMREQNVPPGYYFAKLMELGPRMRTN
jgi:hypothetical protein